MAKDIWDRLDWKGTGGHPDHGTPDPIFREAADKILLLRADLAKMKDYAWRAAAMLRFLHAHDGECLGDHPDWIKRIDALLSEQPG